MLKTGNVITEEIIRAHLIDLGYAPDSLPPAVMLDFIAELSALYEAGELDIEDNVDRADEFDRGFESGIEEKTVLSEAGGQSRILRGSYTRNGSVKNDKHYAMKSKFQDPERVVKESPHDWNGTDYKNSSSDELHNLMNLKLNLSSFRETALAQKSRTQTSSPYDYASETFDDDNISFVSQPSSHAKQKYSTGFIRVPQPVKPKRNDPVARYHAHQAQWNKDGYLKRLSTKSTTGVAGRWGGMAAIIHEEPVKKRHNLADKLPKYTIPSQNKRKDVIWEVRNRLALDRT